MRTREDQNDLEQDVWMLQASFEFCFSWKYEYFDNLIYYLMGEIAGGKRNSAMRCFMKARSSTEESRGHAIHVWTHLLVLDFHFSFLSSLDFLFALLFLHFLYFIFILHHFDMTSLSSIFCLNVLCWNPFLSISLHFHIFILFFLFYIQVFSRRWKPKGKRSASPTGNLRRGNAWTSAGCRYRKFPTLSKTPSATT